MADTQATLNALLGLPEGAGRFPLLVFAAHAAVALAAFWLAATSVPEGGLVRALPVFGIGILFVILGRSAARLAAMR